uniref:Uncharacterized protein n=1 Tax=Romanomermis culicivorax TaxID=13658 RepID=A0A915KBB3_ROMCU
MQGCAVGGSPLLPAGATHVTTGFISTGVIFHESKRQKYLLFTKNANNMEIAAIIGDENFDLLTRILSSIFQPFVQIGPAIFQQIGRFYWEKFAKYRKNSPKFHEDLDCFCNRMVLGPNVRYCASESEFDLFLRKFLIPSIELLHEIKDKIIENEAVIELKDMLTAVSESGSIAGFKYRKDKSCTNTFNCLVMNSATELDSGSDY